MPSTIFKNCRSCHHGSLIEDSQLIVSSDGLIADNRDESECQVIDLAGATIAPGFIELQTNGMRGFHFTHFSNAQTYAAKIEDVARYLVTHGVTAFYATIPTVASEDFRRVSRRNQIPPL